MPRGMFITIEGGEGSGKTTLIASLTEKLKQAGREAMITREPGGIPIAEAIRSVLLSRENTAMDARTEALLYAAARRQHLAEKVIPALERGTTVICDRFVDSSLAYQGYARGLGIEEVAEINRFATDGWEPDLTLYLDMDPEAGLARISANGSREVNRLDVESLAFHRRVREGYQLVAARSPERIVTIDAMHPADAVAKEAWEIVAAKLS
ncbi:dTMP kinase [Cohnella lubricantis]|uniref:dTMP kinase n=1 Tax=Cohnella lubricantis TaxID=2163172 RepID=UPI002892C59A|nr:dTMP kinase [Cohnella lubricantis]MBP2119326.1 dTMP kinase [Cohnella lubricantis]